MLGHGGRTAKVPEGTYDLVIRYENGELKETITRKEVELKEIEEDKLGEDLKKMAPEEREKFLKEKLEKRTEAQKELTALLKERSEFIAKEKAKLREKGEASSFDLKVGDTIRAQAAEKGIHYE